MQRSPDDIGIGGFPELLHIRGKLHYVGKRALLVLTLEIVELDVEEHPKLGWIAARVNGELDLCRVPSAEQADGFIGFLHKNVLVF